MGKITRAASAFTLLPPPAALPEKRPTSPKTLAEAVRRAAEESAATKPDEKPLSERSVMLVSAKSPRTDAPKPHKDERAREEVTLRPCLTCLDGSRTPPSSFSFIRLPTPKPLVLESNATAYTKIKEQLENGGMSPSLADRTAAVIWNYTLYVLNVKDKR